MSGKLTEQEVLDVLRAVDLGEVTIPAADKENAASQYVNNVTMHLSNGWVFVIFNDCDEWDYIVEVTAACGRTLDFDDISGRGPVDDPPMPTLYNFQPANSERDWGFG